MPEGTETLLFLVMTFVKSFHSTILACLDSINNFEQHWSHLCVFLANSVKETLHSLWK